MMAIFLGVCTALHLGALMAWFGALSLQWVLPRRLVRAKTPPLLPAAALVLVSGVVWPWLETAVVLDDSWALLDPGQVAQVLTQTSFGRIWLLRELVVVLAILGSTVPLLASGRATYVLVAGALASMALLGHAAGVPGVAGTLERVTMGLHLLAAGAWLGALPLLWLMAGELETPVLALALQRFSRYGLVMVGIVVTTGAISAALRTGSVQALLGSDYGRVLLGKIGLVALMGVTAIINRNRLTPALVQPDLIAREA